MCTYSASEICNNSACNILHFFDTEFFFHTCTINSVPFYVHFSNVSNAAWSREAYAAMKINIQNVKMFKAERNAFLPCATIPRVKSATIPRVRACIFLALNFSSTLAPSIRCRFTWIYLTFQRRYDWENLMPWRKSKYKMLKCSGLKEMHFFHVHLFREWNLQQIRV